MTPAESMSHVAHCLQTFSPSMSSATTSPLAEPLSNAPSRGDFRAPHLSTWWKPVAMSHNSPSAHVQPAANIAGDLVSTSPLAGCDRLKWR
jgi:hypothetical protein